MYPNRFQLLKKTHNKYEIFTFFTKKRLRILKNNLPAYKQNNIKMDNGQMDNSGMGKSRRIN